MRRLDSDIVSSESLEDNAANLYQINGDSKFPKSNNFMREVAMVSDLDSQGDDRENENLRKSISNPR